MHHFLKNIFTASKFFITFGVLSILVSSPQVAGIINYMVKIEKNKQTLVLNFLHR